MGSSTKTLLRIASCVFAVEGPNYIKINYFADTFPNQNTSGSQHKSHYCHPPGQEANYKMPN